MPDGIKILFATALDVLSPEPREEVGTIRRDGQRTYKYVIFDGAGADAVVSVGKGDIVWYENYGLETVHGDVSAIAGEPICAGQIQGVWSGEAAASAIRYGWIQIQGLSAGLNVAVLNTPVQGATLTSPATTDKTFDIAVDTTASGSRPVWAVNTDGAAFKRVLLLCPI